MAYMSDFLGMKLRWKGDENDLGGFHTFRACQGQEFTLENLVNYIIKRCMDFGTEQLKLEGVHITLDKIEYAFLIGQLYIMTLYTKNQAKYTSILSKEVFYPPKI